jgi:hypothetical protein
MLNFNNDEDSSKSCCSSKPQDCVGRVESEVLPVSGEETTREEVSSTDAQPLELVSVSPLQLDVFFCRFQDRQVVGANLRLALESPLLVQARRIALGDRTPVVLANLGSDRYPPWVTGKRAARSGRPLGITLLQLELRRLRGRAAPPWPPFALRMPGAGLLHILPGFSVQKGSWQCRVFAAGDSRRPQTRRGSRLPAEMRTGIVCLHFSYPDSIRTRARRFLRCIPCQVCFEPLSNG